jgi:hypothetical protein
VEICEAPVREDDLRQALRRRSRTEGRMRFP